MGILLLGAAAFCVDGLGAAANLYGGFALPTRGTRHLPVEELAFFAWYLSYGTAFVLLLTAGLELIGFAPRLHSGLRSAAGWRGWPWLLPFAAGVTSVAVRQLVLLGEPVADDEGVYRFIARTLLEGRVINPLPGDPEFFRMQFVVQNSRGWFGKYPIGHSLVLAVGMLTRLEQVVIPILGGVTALLTYRLGRALLGPRRALVGLLLVALSPHFTWTHATLLSQTTACFALVAASAAVAPRRPGPAAPWLSGLALGLGVLTRPAPAVLFAPPVILHQWLAQKGRPFMARAKSAAGLAVGVGLGAGAVAVVNALQAGSPLESGYHEVHGGIGWMWGGIPGQTSVSVLGALLRENVWLLGWPLSLLPVLFARPRRGAVLLWGPLLAQLVYRVLIPKTVVSTTGPIYVMETVPMLALLAADGLARLELLLGRWWSRDRARALLATSVFASTLASVLLFQPVAAQSANAGARARRVVADLLAEQGATRAVVFSRELVELSAGLTWAYYPPTPSPRLDDAVLYLSWPRKLPPSALADFARRRFPDRAPFAFLPGKDARLIPLSPSARGAPEPPGLPEPGQVPTPD